MKPLILARGVAPPHNILLLIHVYPNLNLNFCHGFNSIKIKCSISTTFRQIICLPEFFHISFKANSPSIVFTTAYTLDESLSGALNTSKRCPLYSHDFCVERIKSSHFNLLYYNKMEFLLIYFSLRNLHPLNSTSRVTKSKSSPCSDCNLRPVDSS